MTSRAPMPPLRPGFGGGPGGLTGKPAPATGNLGGGYPVQQPMPMGDPNMGVAPVVGGVKGGGQVSIGAPVQQPMGDPRVDPRIATEGPGFMPPQRPGVSFGDPSGDPRMGRPGPMAKGGANKGVGARPPMPGGRF